MALKLVTGRANVGKTGVLYAGLGEALPPHGRPVVLLPTHPDVERTRDEFTKLRAVGLRVATLDSWMEELWSLWGDGRRWVRPASRRALIGEALRRRQPRHTRVDLAGPGLTRLLALLASRKCGGLDLHDAAPAEEGLAEALGDYESILEERRLIEPSAAAAALAENPPPVVGPVVVNRFTDLAPAQEAFLLGLASRAEVRIGLVWEEAFPATEALTPLVRRLAKAGEHVHLGAPRPQDELAHVEAALFDPTAPLAPAGAVRLCVADGAGSEVELVAREARRLVESGIAPERVAVVFRRLERRARRLEGALRAEGLLADLDIAFPLPGTSFGRALLALLRVVAGEAGRQEMLAFLATHYSDARTADIFRTDAAWRLGRVDDTRKSLSSAARMGQVTRRIVESGREAARGVSSETVASWGRLLDDMLSCALATSGSAEGGPCKDVAAQRAAAAVIGELAALGTPVALEEAIAALEDAVAVVAVRRPGAVQVTEAHRVRSRRFDALLVGGLTATGFASGDGEPSTAEIARRLGLPEGADESLAGRLLFYSLVTRPRAVLVLSRETGDGMGGEVAPSPFWEEMLDLYRPAGEETDEIPEGLPVTRLGASDLAVGAPAFQPGRKDLRERSAAAPRPRPAPSWMLDEEVVARLAATAEFSVTELETYAGCPYRWFYERAIRPRGLDRELDAREHGARAHEMLARFYRELPGVLGVRRVSTDVLEQALALFDEVARSVEGSRLVQARGLSEELAARRATERARETVARDATHLPGFEPLHVELRFGEAEGRRAEFAGVAVRGSIDRVDVGDAGLVVTDYKTSSTTAGWKSFARNALLQVPVYAQVAASLLGLEVVGGAYRSLATQESRGFWRGGLAPPPSGWKRDDVVGGEGLAETLETAGSMVASAVQGIREGRIRPQPSRRACASCLARGCDEGLR